MIFQSFDYGSWFLLSATDGSAAFRHFLGTPPYNVFFVFYILYLLISITLTQKRWSCMKNPNTQYSTSLEKQMLSIEKKFVLLGTRIAVY